ncbi:MAG: hypothetical protein Q8L14_35595 [Myxococcales bacterium]|nr:hypothetical protein [Myxococcales bacterium]
MTSFLFAVGAGFIVALGLIGYALWAKETLDPSLFRGLLVYGGVVAVTQWANAQLVSLRATLQFAFLARFSVVTALLSAVLNVAAVNVVGFDGLLVATLVVAMVSAGVYTHVAGNPLRHVDVASLRTTFPSSAKSMLVMGLPLLVMASVHSVLHTIDNVMALKLLGTEWLGRYTLALSGGAVLYSFANSVTMVLYPHMQVAYGKERTPGALAPFVEKPVKMLAAGLPLLIAPLFFGLPVLARGLLPKFVPGIPAFQCLVVGISFYALAQLPHLSLLSLNKIPQIVAWTVTTAGVAVAASFALTTAGFGLVGIAMAITFAYLIFFAGLLLYAMSFWTTRRSSLALLGRACLTVAFAASLLVLVDHVPLPAPLGFLTDIVVGVARVAIFIAVYLPILMVSDRETGLLREHLYPRVRRLREQSSRRRSV